MLPEPSAPFSRDDFLTDCLGKNVYTLAQAGRAAEAIEAAERQGTWMMQAKVAVSTPARVGDLVRLGFSLIDTNVQLDLACERSAPLPGSADGFEVRDAKAAERAAVEEVSARNLVTSRFHADPRIAPADAEAIKRRWAGNFFEGKRGERLLVAIGGGVVRGFLLTLERGEQGVIDLIALDPAARGKGVAGMLVSAWLGAAPALRRIFVGTQISNVTAIRAYQKLGFRLKDASYALHMHGAGHR